MESIAKLLDKDGILVRWPKSQEERMDCSKYLASKFEDAKSYSEMEVNAILKKWHKFNDHPMLRRELINVELLERSADGREYIKKP